MAQFTRVLALAALTLALIEGGHAGVTSLVTGAAVIFVVATATFIVIKRLVGSPMLPLSLFRNVTFCGGNLVGLLIKLGFYGELFVINLYFHQVRGYSALVAGLALLPQMGVVAAGSALSGWYTARAGASGTINAARQVGGVIGMALLGALVAGGPTIPGLRIALVIAGAAFLVGAAVTVVTVHHHHS